MNEEARKRLELFRLRRAQAGQANLPPAHSLPSQLEVLSSSPNASKEESRYSTGGYGNSAAILEEPPQELALDEDVMQWMEKLPEESVFTSQRPAPSSGTGIRAPLSLFIGQRDLEEFADAADQPLLSPSPSASPLPQAHSPLEVGELVRLDEVDAGALSDDQLLDELENLEELQAAASNEDTSSYAARNNRENDLRRLLIERSRKHRREDPASFTMVADGVLVVENDEPVPREVQPNARRGQKRVVNHRRLHAQVGGIGADFDPEGSLGDILSQSNRGEQETLASSTLHRIPGPVGLLPPRALAPGESWMARALAQKRKAQREVALADPIVVKKSSVTEPSLADLAELERSRSFRSAAWFTALEDLGAAPFGGPDGSLAPGLIGYVRAVVPFVKVPQLVLYVNQIHTERDATAKLADPSESISASIHEEVVHKYSKQLGNGAVLILRNITLLYFADGLRALISLANIHRIVPASSEYPAALREISGWKQYEVMRPFRKDI